MMHIKQQKKQKKQVKNSIKILNTVTSVIPRETSFYFIFSCGEKTKKQNVYQF